MREIRSGTDTEISFFGRLVNYGISSYFRALVQAQEGQLEALIGYDHWTPNSVQMHIWVCPGCSMTRRLVKLMFHYPFIACDRGVAVAVFQPHNRPVLEVTRRLGFCEIATIKDGWLPGTDTAIWELRREHCKWIKEFLHEQGQQCPRVPELSSRRISRSGLQHAGGSNGDQRSPP